MVDPTSKAPRSGASPAAAGARGGSPLLGQVRERLAQDPQWAHVAQNGKWICPFCLSAVAKRQGRTREDSIALHLDGCRGFAAGRGQACEDQRVQERLYFEDMTWQAETSPAWRIYDHEGVWWCPSCLNRIPTVRLQAGQLNNFVFQAMAGHLRLCAAYAAGRINPAEVVVAQRDRPAVGSDSTATGATRIALPAQMAPAAPARQPTSGAVPVAPPIARPLGAGTPSRGVSTAPPASTPARGAATTAPSPSTVPSASPASGSQVVHPMTPSSPAPPRMPTPPPLPFEPVEAPAPSVAEPASGAASEDPSGRAESLSWLDDAESKQQSEVTPVNRLERTDVIHARTLQENMFSDAPVMPGFRFAARAEACDEITGDFYEFIKLADGRMGFAVGDVSGHGVQAGLVMSMARKTLEIYASSGFGPAETIAKVNDSLARDLGGKLFISMMYGIIDPQHRTITWARAGHTPVIRYNTRTGTLSEIKPKGMVVGMKSGFFFRQSLEEESTRVEGGDVFVLYTDGLIEAMNLKNEEFGIERLIEIVQRCAESGPDALIDQTLSRIRHFRGSQPANDDQTLLVLCVD